MEQFCVFRVDFRDRLFFAFDLDRKPGRVAESVCQLVSQVIGARFVDSQDSAVKAFDETKPVSRVDKTFDIERTVFFPFFKVCETVEVTTFIESETIQVTMKNNLAVCRQCDVFDTINIGGIIHVIVSFYSQSDFSPGFNLSGQCLFPVLGCDRF